MAIDGVGLRKQTVTRHQRRHSGKQSEQSVKNDPRRDRKKAILGYLVRGSPQDVFPTRPRDLHRQSSAPASTRFFRALKMRLQRLLSALWFAKCRLVLGPRRRFAK